jgi:tRNA 2-thiouridine synthesizing protein A
MIEVKTVDARGLSCPEPAMLANKALKQQKAGVIEVLVDSSTARENVTRLAISSGWAVTQEKQPDGSFKLEIKKNI